MTNEDQGRIRARRRDGVVTVKVLLRHPMETGARKESPVSEPVPRHFIRDVVCKQNGTPVLTLEWGWGIAANPYLSFDLIEGQVGDRIAVHWVDNKGETGRIEGVVI